MTKLYVSLMGKGKCNVRHDKSTTILITESPREYGGTGNEFSSTDLLSAALGTCIATTIEDIIVRNKIKYENIEILVNKELSSATKEFKHININILIKEKVDLKILEIIKKSAKSCLVHNSLIVKSEIRVKSFDN